MLSATSKPQISAVSNAGGKNAASRGKTGKAAVVEVETPKQIQRRLLKLYEQLCAAEDSLVLSSVKRTLRAGMHQETPQARVCVFYIGLI